MRSKKTIGVLAGRLAWLNDWLTEDAEMTDALVKVTGGSWIGTHEFEDGAKLRRQYESEKLRIESWLHPQKGRPRLNASRIQAATKDWMVADGRKPSLRQLAIRHSGSRDPKEQKKFAEALKKTLQRMSSKKGE